MVLVLGGRAVLPTHRLVFLGVFLNLLSMGDLSNDLCHPVYLNPLTACSMQKDKHIPLKLFSLKEEALVIYLSFLWFVFLHGFCQYHASCCILPSMRNYPQK